MLIRVDPSILRQSSGNILGVGTNLTQTGQSVLSVARSAPSYDGQFGPKVASIGADAYSRAQGLSSQMNNQSGTLQSRAQAFEAADLFGVTSFANTSQDSSILKQDPSFLGALLQNIPESEILKYLKLGELLFPGIGTGLLVDYLLLSSTITWKGAIWEGSFGNVLKIDGIPVGSMTTNAALLSANASKGIGYDANGDLIIGGDAEGNLAEVEQIKVLGNKDFGITKEDEADIGHVEGLLGYKDGNVGALLSADLINYDETWGINVAGVNVGVIGQIGLGPSLGGEVGMDHFKAGLGPFEIGLGIKIGKAI